MCVQELNGTMGESSTDRVEFPLLTLRSLTSVVDLVPFFNILCCSFNGSSSPSTPLPRYAADYPPPSSDRILKRLEHIIEGEFLDGMDSQMIPKVGHFWKRKLFFPNSVLLLCMSLQFSLYFICSIMSLNKIYNLLLNISDMLYDLFLSPTW